MTVCFFAPIMLLLYAVFFHLYDTMSLGELAAFEFVIIDLAFYMSASDRAPT
jgi:EamA domain-containing membrane protein RarD